LPILVLIGLIIVLGFVSYFILRPLKVLNKKDWLITHAFILIGLILILGWLWLNRDKYFEITMLMGGIWTLFGGLCFAVTYVARRLKNK
jgi:hypothetical protein